MRDFFGIKMNIIFLDIDGVLNSGRSFLAFAKDANKAEYENDPYWLKITKATIDPVSVGLLNRILERCDAYIVLSSTHRAHFPDGPNKLQQIQEYLTVLGVDGARCIGFTPRLGTIRGIEIQNWLEDHERGYENLRAVILDDSSDFLPEQMQFHVHCEGGHGITEENFYDACKLFGMDQGLILA